VGGLWALFNPVRTFAVMADILGFLFVLVGIGWIVQALAVRESDAI
jgi:uncharacterized membrane protein HdeD (DUF308 family)